MPATAQLDKVLDTALAEGHGTITIRAVNGDGHLTVSVADTGEGVKTSKGGGVGLSNIRERLKALYGNSARLVMEENFPRGVVASIEVPA